MKKTSVIGLALLGCVGQVQAASTGTINFSGTVSAMTCDVRVNGQEADGNVALPVVSVVGLGDLLPQGPGSGARGEQLPDLAGGLLHRRLVRGGPGGQGQDGGRRAERGAGRAGLAPRAAPTRTADGRPPAAASTRASCSS